MTMGKMMWISENHNPLQLRLCITVHTIAACHRDQRATENATPGKFYLHKLSQDVALFFKGCLHRLSTTERGQFSCPFVSAVHDTILNALL